MKTKKKDRILEELYLISKQHKGVLNPKDVVKFAKNKATALHKCFTWDNTKAAAEWRLHEARMLIRTSVTVLVDDDKTEYRAFVSLKEDRYSKIGYRPMITVLSDKLLREQMLKDALEEFEVFQEKYKVLKELSRIFAAFEKIKEAKP